MPFGGQRDHTGTVVSDYKYTGQELDTSTGLYNYGARLYDPLIGRFISPDTIVQAPSDPQTLNRYTYCRNNPLIYVDPTGHALVHTYMAKFSGASSGYGGGSMNASANSVMSGGFLSNSGSSAASLQMHASQLANATANNTQTMLYSADIIAKGSALPTGVKTIDGVRTYPNMRPYMCISGAVAMIMDYHANILGREGLVNGPTTKENRHADLGAIASAMGAMGVGAWPDDGRGLGSKTMS